MRLLGEGVERKKPNAAVTVSWRDTEWDRPPPVTLIETVTVPVGTDSVAVKETLTVQVGLHGLFVKYAVTPSGRSEAVMVTGTAEPDGVTAYFTNNPCSPTCTVSVRSEEHTSELQS